ncbi:MAG: class II fructose-bisphosphate aldolase [Ignavibacteriales bacterium]|nr:class II fructose-bisphosphate aldolase [Ignavibacteriales bacterium]
MKLPTLEILKNAYGKYGVAAFNVFNAEQIHGVFGGSQLAEMPIIVQITPAARNYTTPEFLEGMISSAAKVYPNTEFSVHLDHGNYEHCLSAIDNGFYGSVMIDASHEEFEKNISISSDIVKRAHDKGIAVEAELGVLSGVEDDINISAEKSKYTDPDQVVEFIERTQCDSLAVAVGTSHGAYKMSGGKGLQLSILENIQKLLPGFPIVLHGASNVPLDEIEKINKYGGNISSKAKGVDEKEMLQAIKFGVTKINIATDLRLIWTRIHREFFSITPELFDPVIPGKTYIEELTKFVNKKCQSLKINNYEN